MITFLQAVNRTLIKLRESQCSGLAGATDYQILIANFVNEAKEEVEDAWDWNALQTRITVTSVAGDDTYSLTGGGEDFELYDAWNVSRNYRFPGPYNSDFVNEQTMLGGTSTAPSYFDFAGQDSNGDPIIRVSPVPAADGETWYFYGYAKQGYLETDGTDDNTSIIIPWKPVVFGAYAKAVSERGEDGGIPFAEADMQFRNALADAIAKDSARYHKNTDWYPA